MDGKELTHNRTAYKREYNRATYSLMKSLGLCKCGRPLAIGFASCPDCLENDRQQKQRKREHDRPAYNRYMSTYQKDMRERRVANHLCTACGKPLSADTKYRECTECRVRRIRSREARRERTGNISRFERAGYGLCYYCGEPVLEGYRTCPKCYERNLGLLEIANATEAGREAKEKYAKETWKMIGGR